MSNLRHFNWLRALRTRLIGGPLANGGSHNDIVFVCSRFVIFYAWKYHKYYNSCFEFIHQMNSYFKTGNMDIFIKFSKLFTFLLKIHKELWLSISTNVFILRSSIQLFWLKLSRETGSDIIGRVSSEQAQASTTVAKPHFVQYQNHRSSNCF